MRVDYNQVYCLVRDFREAIDTAKRKGVFDEDKDFKYFPDDCCGPTCTLLAEFLRRYDIETLYVYGVNHKQETHAWLIVNDDRICDEIEYLELSDTLFNVLKSYGGSYASKTVEMKGYDKKALLNGLGIDITADQFGKEPIHIGEWKRFEYPFEYRTVQEHNGLSDRRLIKLYKEITSIIFDD